MTFQALEDKGHNFLDLLDDNNNPLKLTYPKDGTWLKFIMCKSIESNCELCTNWQVPFNILSPRRIQVSLQYLSYQD